MEPELRIRQEPVQNTEHLARYRRQGYVSRFVSGAQTLVELSQDRIVADRTECRHEQSTPHSGPTALNDASATARATIVVHWSDSHHRRDQFFFVSPGRLANQMDRCIKGCKSLEELPEPAPIVFVSDVEIVTGARDLEFRFANIDPYVVFVF